MNISDQIIQLARENNGVITTSDLSEKGILRGNLKKLVDTGKLEKTARTYLKDFGFHFLQERTSTKS